MASVDVCDQCSGNVQHSSNLNNTYDVPWTVFVNDDRVCVRFVNSTSTNVSVNTWVEDTAGNGPLSDTSYSVPVPPNGETSVCFTAFGVGADQSPISECILHTVLHNDDSESEGVEISHEVY
jgi:hypothetical protein